jgi:hypothetical protein
MITLLTRPAQGPLLSLAVLHRSLAQQRSWEIREVDKKDPGFVTDAKVGRGIARGLC